VTARQPRRTRRRAVPGASLPRPTGEEGLAPGDSSRIRQVADTRHHREHHVTKDYSHVHKDLLTVLGVGIVVLAFIFGMSYLV
jgi:hypothetical protein